MELAAGVARPRPQGTWPAVVTPVAQLTPLQDSAWGPGETWPPGRELSLSLVCVCVSVCLDKQADRQPDFKELTPTVVESGCRVGCKVSGRS